MPDARKTLPQLKAEWESCEKCELGVRRKAVGGQFVFGEGRRRGIMFIGEGPGVTEEAEGVPFVGRSGQLLRTVIGKLGLVDYYISNVVSCRSCADAYDSEGNLIVRRSRSTGVEEALLKDQPPTPKQAEACRPRLQEEIYLVDPIIIVSLGAEATKALTGRAVSILRDRGSTEKIGVPGAWYLPNLTEKKKLWVRKIHGRLSMPTVQNMVEYLLMPTLHPAYVLRTQTDERRGNPLQCFIGDIKKAKAIYDRYMSEAFGIVPSESIEVTEASFSIREGDEGNGDQEDLAE